MNGNLASATTKQRAQFLLFVIMFVVTEGNVNLKVNVMSGLTLNILI